ncbi:hypothetical protein K1719_034006 [Acacia pycnantha]|nr:hypothetical protein K1719_034006 [Acacia pycnantha]
MARFLSPPASSALFQFPSYTVPYLFVFGDVVRVDYNTESGERGKFARIAVVINLTKPLISKIQVDGEIIFVEYEGLPSICFDCGKYGHLQNSCPEKMVPVAGDPSVPAGADPSVPNASPIPIVPPAQEAREAPQFGAWMQVQRRRRTFDRGNKTNVASGSKSKVNGSRYEVLGDVLEEDNVRPITNEPLKGGQYLIEDAANGRMKAKETKGFKKPDKGSKPKASSLQIQKPDIISPSLQYVEKHAATSLDQSSNSVVRIVDPRLPKTTQVGKPKKDGPSRLQPIGGNDPHSKDRGTRLSSGVSIPSLGARPNRECAGPSTKAMKDGIVQRNWDSGRDLLSCIDYFKQDVLRWNSETFGGIGKRKRRLFRRISGIQSKLENCPESCSDFLSDLESSLREELEDVCFQEELLWLQKSSSDWVCLGDRNTGYYHLKALIRRKRNCVSQLKLSDGTWSSSEAQLSSYARQFFVICIRLIALPSSPSLCVGLSRCLRITRFHA